MEDREIDLLDLFAEILLRWRIILICMIVGGILTAGFGYVKSYSRYQADKAQKEALQQAEEQKITEEQKLEEERKKAEEEKKAAEEAAEREAAKKPDDMTWNEWLESHLTELQIVNMNALLESEDYLQKRMEYADTSVLMKIDAQKMPRAEVTFLVTVGTASQEQNLAKIYEDIIVSGDMLEYLAEGQKGMTAAMVSELVSLERSSYGLPEGNNTIRVAIVDSEKKRAQAFIQALIEKLEEECDRLQDVMGRHEITVLNQTYAEIMNIGLLNTQRSVESEIVSLKSGIASTKANFSEAEWKYYYYLTEGTIKNAPHSTAAAQEMPEVPAEAPKGDAPALSSADIILTPPGVSIKYVAVGMILFAFVYAVIVAFCYIMNNKLRAADDFALLYKVPLLGMIPAAPQRKKFMAFVDEWIYAFRNRNKRIFSAEEAGRLAMTAVKIEAKKEETDAVYCVGCDLKDVSLTLCHNMEQFLADDNIKVKTVGNVLYDAEAMEQLSDAKAAVLVEKAGSVLYTEIAKEIELLRRQGIRVLGGIVVE